MTQQQSHIRKTFDLYDFKERIIYARGFRVGGILKRIDVIGKIGDQEFESSLEVDSMSELEKECSLEFNLRGLVSSVATCMFNVENPVPHKEGQVRHGMENYYRLIWVSK